MSSRSTCFTHTLLSYSIAFLKAMKSSALQTAVSMATVILVVSGMEDQPFATKGHTNNSLPSHKKPKSSSATNQNSSYKSHLNLTFATEAQVKALNLRTRKRRGEETTTNKDRNTKLFLGSELYLLLQDLQDCVVHLIEYEPNLVDYSLLKIPFLKSSTKGRQKSISREGVFKTSNVQCFVSVFLMEGNEFSPTYTEESAHPFQYITQSLNVYQNLVLFLGHVAQSNNGKLSFIKSLNQQTFLTPVFYIQYGLQSPSEVTLGWQGPQKVTLTRGFFICKYCSPIGYVFKHFTCPSGQSCYSNMITAYEEQIDKGRNVLWHVYNDPWSLEPDLYEIVINRPSDIDTVDDAKTVTMAFLLQGQNRTLIKEAKAVGSLITENLYETPKVIRKIDRIYARGSLHLLDNGRGYVFITSDEVYDVYDLKSFYIAPFLSTVWYVLIGLVAFLTLALSLAYIGFYGFSNMQIVWETFLWLMGSLLEQSGMKYVPMVTTNVVISKFSKTILGVWVLGCIPLLGFFKGRISASYSIATPYGTKWQQLQQLANFTLYSATWDCSVFPNDTYKVDSNTDPNLTTLCRELPLDGVDNINCKFWTDVTERSYAIQNHAIRTPLLDKRLKALESIESNLVYTCLDYMKKLVQNELKSTKTAFITSRDDLPIFWEQFQEEMVRNTSAKFASNENSGDSWLTNWHINYLSAIDEHHHRTVLRRMEIVLSSGLRWFWDKWSIYNRQRKTFRPKAIKQAQKANQLALTFSGSDIPVIFYTHVSISVLCIVVFFVEIMSCKRKKPTERFPFTYLK